MSQNLLDPGDTGRSRRARWTTLFVAAVAGTLLASAVARSDVLVGTAPPAAVPQRDCTLLPTADPRPLPPEGAHLRLGDLVPSGIIRFLQPVETTAFAAYSTAAEYAESSARLLPDAFRAALAQGDFVAASEVTLKANWSFFGFEAVEFGSPEAATEFAQRVLAAECRAGIAASLRPIPGLAGSVASTYHREFWAPIRASFVVGATAVVLRLCMCSGLSGDPWPTLYELARQADALMRMPL